jgi:prepilin-type N-terminal cleavage/methylation domain-containing protein
MAQVLSPNAKRVGVATRPRRGVTLLELIIVFVIIGILVGLLFPALHAMRRFSHQAACENNMSQLHMALAEYTDLTRGYFPLPPTDRPSGWSIEVLQFIEETSLAEKFDYGLPLTAPRNIAVARHRPPLFICPLVVERASTLEGVEVTDYLLVIDQTNRGRPKRNRPVRLVHAPPGARLPWCTSPEVAPADYTWPPPHKMPFD